MTAGRKTTFAFGLIAIFNDGNTGVAAVHCGKQMAHKRRAENMVCMSIMTTAMVHTLEIIPIYIQQDATLHSLFYLETALHVSGGTTTTIRSAIQLCLQHLVFVTPLLLPAAIVEELEPV